MRTFRRSAPRTSAAVAAILTLLVAERAALAQAAPDAGQVVSGRATAVEGDVLSVGGSKIRLFGIDAPDKGQTCHARGGRRYDCFDFSRRALDALVRGRTADCEIVGVDPDQVRIGLCMSGGVDVAAVLVVRGWALAYHRLSSRYAGAEARAQSRRAGLWSGRVEAPWIWRSKQVTGGSGAPVR